MAYHELQVETAAELDAAIADAQSAIQPNDWDEPSGFESPDLVGVAYDAASRTVTLTQEGGIAYWWRGARIVLDSPWTSDPHATGNGSFFLFSSDGETFAWTADLVWSFEQIQVCVVIVTADFTFALRECHGLMPWQTHLVLHSQIGTFRVSGGGAAAGTYTLSSADNANIVPGFAAGIIMDEDLPTDIAARASGDYKLVHVGADGVSVFTDAVYPFVAAASKRISVNDPATGLFTLEASDKRYLNIYQLMIPVTSDAGSQAYRMVMLQPQAQYSTLAAAQSEDFRALSLGTLGSLSPEIVAYTRLTYYASGYATYGKAVLSAVGYLAGNRASQVAISFSGVSAENVGYTAGEGVTLSATNVAAALDELAGLIAAL